MEIKGQSILNIIVIVGVLALGYVTFSGQGEVTKKNLDEFAAKVFNRVDTLERNQIKLIHGQKNLKELSNEILDKTNEVINVVNDNNSRLSEMQETVYGIKSDTEYIIKIVE